MCRLRTNPSTLSYDESMTSAENNSTLSEFTDAVNDNTLSDNVVNDNIVNEKCSNDDDELLLTPNTRV